MKRINVSSEAVFPAWKSLTSRTMSSYVCILSSEPVFSYDNYGNDNNKNAALKKKKIQLPNMSEDGRTIYKE